MSVSYDNLLSMNRQLAAAEDERETLRRQVSQLQGRVEELSGALELATGLLQEASDFIEQLPPAAEAA